MTSSPAPVPLAAELEDLEIWQRALAAAHGQLQRSQATLMQAHKLEAIGQLAAGVAHEINTPVQYISDNVAYVAAAFTSIGELVRTCAAAIGADGAVDAAALGAARAASAAVDVQQLLIEIPRALTESLEGLERVASIVAALRSFSHPSRGRREPFDLNHGLLTTIAVARNEWRYVAEVATDLDPALPPVVGIRDELGQVFLNLIVNAAHAIAEATERGRPGRGVIAISSRQVRDQVTIRISDTGDGIPDEIRDRVFEPFFTTKALGRGTGQGLALTRSVVVERHAGAITFESTCGTGTTFIVTLPIGGSAGGSP